MNKEWQYAIKEGDLDQVSALLKIGMDVDAKDHHGQTALMNAAHAGQIELVRLLVENGANLNSTAKYNLSALMLALIARHPEVARLLIEAGADLNIQGRGAFHNKTAYSLAEDSGQGELAALLRQTGAIR